MDNDTLHAPTSLSDADLLSRLRELAQGARTATVELIAHLAEMDARKLYRGQGYGSLFDYCTGELRLSEDAAYNRIEAARLARAFPVVLERLADGSVNLTTLRLLAPHLRPENHLQVLAEAAGMRKREVAVLIARLAPQPDLPDSVRKLPAPLSPDVPRERSGTVPGADTARPRPESDRPASCSSASIGMTQSSSSGMETLAGRETLAGVETLGALPAAQPAAARDVVSPLAPERYRVQFTVERETHEKLRRAQDLLRREIPEGDLAVIFDRGLTLLLAEIAKKKLGATSTRRTRKAVKERTAGTVGGATAIATPVEVRARRVPADVRRTVWLRDQGQCAFVARNGRRCAARAYLEFHHVEPYAIGGEPTARNMSLRCRAHNVYEAELAFGTEVIGMKMPGPARCATRSGTSSASVGGDSLLSR